MPDINEHRCVTRELTIRGPVVREEKSGTQGIQQRKGDPETTAGPAEGSKEAGSERRQTRRRRHSEQGAQGRGRAWSTHQDPMTQSPPLLPPEHRTYLQPSHLHNHVSMLVEAPSPHGSETGGSLEMGPLSIFPKHPICPKVVILFIQTTQASP